MATINTNSDIAPYSPVKYSDLECRVFNLIGSRTLSFNMVIGKEKVSVELGFDGTTFPYQGVNPDRRTHLAFEAADELWQISFQRTRFLYELMEAADRSGFFDDTEPESLPEDVLWAVLEAFLSESLAKTEASLGYPVKIAPPANPPPFDCFSTRFTISFDGRGDGGKRVHGFFMIPFKDSCVSLLETLFSDFPPRLWKEESLLGLKKTVFFEAGSLLLKAEELCAMEVGDVLIRTDGIRKRRRLPCASAPDSFFVNMMNRPGGSR